MVRYSLKGKVYLFDSTETADAVVGSMVFLGELTQAQSQDALEDIHRAFDYELTLSHIAYQMMMDDNKGYDHPRFEDWVKDEHRVSAYRNLAQSFWRQVRSMTHADIDNMINSY